MAASETKQKGSPRLALNDHRAVRRTLTRLMRLRFAGSLDSELFRDLVYAANTVLQFDKLAADLRIESRLDELEAQLAERTANSRPDQRMGPGALEQEASR